MNLQKRFFFLALFGAFLGLCVGCNGNVHISGKVTYPDGTPLSIGQIIFTDDFYMGRSDINKDGEYSLHTFRRNDGVKPGIYKVYITGAMRFERDDAWVSKSDEHGLGNARLDRSINLIDMQYMNPDTSGWLFDLRKSQKINFIVYPPGEVPDEERTEAAKLFFDEDYRKQIKKEQDFSLEAEKKHRRVNPKLL